MDQGRARCIRIDLDWPLLTSLDTPELVDAALEPLERDGVKVEGRVFDKAGTDDGDYRKAVTSDERLRRVLPGVETLVLQFNAIESSFPFSEADFPNLRSVYIEPCQCGDGVWPAFFPSTLTRLHLGNIPLASFLSSLTQLDTLVLSSVTPGDHNDDPNEFDWSDSEAFSSLRNFAILNTFSDEGYIDHWSQNEEDGGESPVKRNLTKIARSLPHLDHLLLGDIHHPELLLAFLRALPSPPSALTLRHPSAQDEDNASGIRIWAEENKVELRVEVYAGEEDLYDASAWLLESIPGSCTEP
ncbi:hypothetical protein JCM8097_006123 [Rhodosporidiobolus ruineniae]